MKRIAFIILLCFTKLLVFAQLPDSLLLNNQNPNYQKSKNKYTTPSADSIKNKKTPIINNPAEAIIASPISTSVTAATAEPYIKKLKKAEETFVSKGNFKDAYAISLQLKELTDSLVKNETRQSELRSRLSYDSLQQAESKKTYNKNLLQKQSELDSSRKIIYLVIMGFGLALLVAFAFFRNYKASKKTNQIIEQQKLETEEKKRIIENSLVEKETLLKEIHHRVKNNLQIVSSLLNLQANRMEDDNLKKIMTEAKNRINSMALIHQKIYQSGNLSSIDFQTYIEQMTQSMEANFNVHNKKITYDINTNGVVLDIDTSIPLGLIINELLTNIYKYAFIDRDKGRITINLQQKNEEELELHIADDGVGLPSNFDMNTVNSLGVKLIKGLSNQLKGAIRYENNNGTHCFINFKKPLVN